MRVIRLYDVGRGSSRYIIPYYVLCEGIELEGLVVLVAVFVVNRSDLEE